MNEHDDWLKVRKRNHPGTKTLQRMLWLCIYALTPIFCLTAYFGYFEYLIAQATMVAPFVVLMILNRDEYLHKMRVLGSALLITTNLVHGYFLGCGSGIHLFFLLTLFGLTQVFTFARQDPWLVRLQVYALFSLVLVVIFDGLGLCLNYIHPEHIAIFHNLVIAGVVSSGVFLIILYKRSIKRHYQSAAIEVGDFFRLIQNSPNALLIIDAQSHRVLDSNDNFFKLFEYPNKKSLPGHLTKVLVPAFSEEESEEISNAIDAKQQWKGTRDFHSQTGKVVQCRIVITRIRIDQNQCNLIRIFDMSREVSFKESLEKTKTRLELALQASQDGIWEWDVQTNEIYISPRWKEMFGYEDHEIGSKFESFENLILEEDKEQVITLMHAFVKQQVDFYHITERYRHKNGNVVYVDSRAVRVCDEDGRTKKIVGSHTDITALIESEQQLRKAIHEATTANEAKSLFLANMSHEIRTPLLSILGFAEQLQDQRLSNEASELVSIIQSSGKTLNQLLLDILDFERIRRGKLELAPTLFNPKSVIEKLGKEYSIRASIKGIDFFMDLQWDDREEILGDEMRFRQILVNLFENAIKFTDTGGIRIILLSREKEGQRNLCACVTDSGPGIPKKFLSNIFQAFTQRDATFSRKYEGSGLGLGIVKQLVQLMNGNITVESPPTDHIPGSPQGSRFILTIPIVVKASTAPNSEAEATVYQKQFIKTTVLLAEDNPLNQRLASHTLRKFGLNIVVASDGNEAIEKVEQHPEISAVLMDIQMPHLDGYGACKGIKALRPELPVIGISANAYPEDIARAKEAGMIDYLSKPYSQKQLFDILTPYMEIQEEENAVY